MRGKLLWIKSSSYWRRVPLLFVLFFVSLSLALPAWGAHDNNSGPKINMMEYRQPTDSTNVYRIFPEGGIVPLVETYTVHNNGSSLIWNESWQVIEEHYIQTDQGVAKTGTEWYDGVGSFIRSTTYDHPIIMEYPAGTKQIGASWGDGFVETSEGSWFGSTSVAFLMATILGVEDVEVGGQIYPNCVKVLTDFSRSVGVKTVVWYAKGIGFVKRIDHRDALGGRVWELIDRITPEPQITLGFKYVQYRVYPGGVGDRYQAWIMMTKDGADVIPEDIDNITLYAPDDTPVAPANTTYLAGRSAMARWNGNGDPSPYNLTLYSYSGFALNLSNHETLPGGEYKFLVETDSGIELASTVYFPDTVAVPVVDGATMSGFEYPEGHIILNWYQPSGAFDQYQVIIYDQAGNDVFSGRAYPTEFPGTHSITFPPDLVTTIYGIAAPGDLTFLIQTRLAADGHNFARGHSPRKLIQLATP